jgi:hypothetical protein
MKRGLFARKSPAGTRPDRESGPRRCPAPPARRRRRSSRVRRRPQHPELRLAGPERVFRLHRRHGMHRARPAQGGGRDLRQTDPPDQPLLDEAHKGFHHLFDGAFRLPPVDVEQLHPVPTEPRQRPFQRPAQRLFIISEMAGWFLHRCPPWWRCSPRPGSGKGTCRSRLALAVAIDLGHVPVIHPSASASAMQAKLSSSSVPP